MGGAEEREEDGRGKDKDFEAGKLVEEEWLEEGVEGRLWLESMRRIERERLRWRDE